MSALAYTRYELLRTFRNRRFFLFSLGFPLVLYCADRGRRTATTTTSTGTGIPLAALLHGRRSPRSAR